MSRKCPIVFLLLAVFFTGLASAAVPPKKVTGMEWLLMTRNEKTEYLATAMDFLQKRGIPLQRPAGYYLAALNVVTDAPGAQKSEILNLLTSVIYKDDPRAKQLIDKMKKKPTAKPGKVSLPPA